jgi:hypothetical protein
MTGRAGLVGDAGCARGAAPAAAAPLQPCRDDKSARCGAIAVPVHRSDPHGPKLKVRFRVFPRSDRSRPPARADRGPGYSTIGSASGYEFMLSGAGSLPPPGHSLPRHVRAVLRRPVAQVHGRVSAGIRLPALARAEVRGPLGGAGRDLPRRAGAGARRRSRLGHPPRGLRGGGRAVCELAPGGRPQRRARDRAVGLRPLRLRSLCAASSPSSIRATRVAPSGSPELHVVPKFPRRIAQAPAAKAAARTARTRSTARPPGRRREASATPGRAGC